MTTHASVAFSNQTSLTLGHGICCRCYILRRNLHIHVEVSDYKLILHRVPQKYLPYNDNPNPPVLFGDLVVLDTTRAYDGLPHPITTHFYQIGSSPGMPMYGVHALSGRIYDTTIDLTSTQIAFHFWLAERANRENSSRTVCSAGSCQTLDYDRDHSIRQ